MLKQFRYEQILKVNQSSQSIKKQNREEAEVGNDPTTHSQPLTPDIFRELLKLAAGHLASEMNLPLYLSSTIGKCSIFNSNSQRTNTDEQNYSLHCENMSHSDKL